MNNSHYPHRKFLIRPKFVIVAVILLLLCIIIAVPLAVIHSGQKHQAGSHTTPTPNPATTITLPKVPTPTATLGQTTEAKKIEIDILDNIQQNGWDNDPSINGVLGGLWINWRYGTNPLQVNFNGTASPDEIGGAPLRHDPLTDIRYLHNLWSYKSQNPNDTRFDGAISKFTALIKSEWANAHDAQRGWLYDEEQCK